MERVAEYMRLEGETEGSGSVDDNWPQGEVVLEAAPRQKMAEDGKLEEASRVVRVGPSQFNVISFYIFLLT